MYPEGCSNTDCTPRRGQPVLAAVVIAFASAMASCERPPVDQRAPVKAPAPTSDVVRAATETELRRWLISGLLSGERAIDVERPQFYESGHYYQGGNATISGEYLLSGNTYCVYHSAYAIRLYCMDVFVGPNGLHQSEASSATDLAAEEGRRAP